MVDRPEKLAQSGSLAASKGIEGFAFLPRERPEEERQNSRGDIRNDGQLRARVQVRPPAVAVSFETDAGPERYPCSTTPRSRRRGAAGRGLGHERPPRAADPFRIDQDRT